MTDVRRSAEKRPRPLQKVRIVTASPNRGKRSTRIRALRTIHDALVVRADVQQIGVGDVLKPAGDRVEANAPVAAGVGDPRQQRPLEDAAFAGLSDELGEAGRLGHRG